MVDLHSGSTLVGLDDLRKEVTCTTSRPNGQHTHKNGLLALNSCIRCTCIGSLGFPLNIERILRTVLSYSVRSTWRAGFPVLGPIKLLALLAAVFLLQTPDTVEEFGLEWRGTCYPPTITGRSGNICRCRPAFCLECSIHLVFGLLFVLFVRFGLFGARSK
jgi:hypothetical protein